MDEDERNKEIADIERRLQALKGERANEAKEPLGDTLPHSTENSLLIPFLVCIAFVVVVGLGFSIFSKPQREPSAVDPLGPTQAVAPTEPPAPTIDLVETRRPAAEGNFISAIWQARSAYDAGANDLAKGGARSSRGRAICAALSDKKAETWTGRISSLSSNSEGRGVLAIDLGDGTKVRTWNNAYSDTDSGTLIQPGTALFQTLSQLHEGDPVVFSGSFFPDPLDCVIETSFVSLDTSMSSPAFLMRFTAVSRLDANTPTPPARPTNSAQEAPPVAAAQSAVYPTSFDCTKAVLAADVLICTDPELANLDRQIADLYRDALYFDTYGAIRAEARTEMYRRNQCADRACLLDWYARRRSTLSQSGAGQSAAVGGNQ